MSPFLHFGALLIPVQTPAGVVATELKHYIAYLTAIERYVAFFLWTVLVWIVWLSVIWNHFQNKGRSKINPGDINPLVGTNSTTNGTTTGMATSLASADSDTTSQLNLMVTIGRFWFGLVICVRVKTCPCSSASLS